MFNFIKRFFEKERKSEAVMAETEAVINTTRERAQVLKSEARNNSDELDALLEKAREARRENAKWLNSRGVVHKFRDRTTGEIYEVQPDDFETFDKMMVDKNTSIVYD